MTAARCLRRTPWVFLAAAIALLVAGSTLTGCASAPRGEACVMAPDDAEWLAAAVDTWAEASARLERIDDPFPHAIVFDAECAWNLNAPDRHGAVARHPALSFRGEALPLRATRHGGAIALPSGQTVGTDPLAFTGLAETGATFFVMALPSVWRRHPGMMPGEDVGEFARGVFAHEVVHTLHLAPIAAAFEEMGERWDLPEQLDDDHLQRVFSENPDYVAAYEREEALLWESIRAPDDARSRELALQALDLADARRAKYFTGPHEFFREAEPIFLNMEGVASWVAYHVAPEDGDPEEHAGAYWSQRHGLALFLILDRHDPGWKQIVFSDPAPSPYAMLRRALTAPRG